MASGSGAVPAVTGCVELQRLPAGAQPTLKEQLTSNMTSASAKDNQRRERAAGAWGAAELACLRSVDTRPCQRSAAARSPSSAALAQASSIDAFCCSSACRAKGGGGMHGGRPCGRTASRRL